MSTRSSSARSSSPWCCSCRAACSGSCRAGTGSRERSDAAPSHVALLRSRSSPMLTVNGIRDDLMATTVLEIERLTKRFGGVTAVDGVSLRLEAGRIYGLIGPNGAGKTPLFNCITDVDSRDEGAGVNRTLLNDLLDAVRHLRNQGRTVLLVEHDMKVVMGLCEAVFVLDHGEKIAEGAPGVIQTDERVIEAYFGR